jgi:ABC-type multidrug transport system ATPase subunit
MSVFTPVPAVAACDVTKTYRAGVAGCSAQVDALRGVSIEIAPSESVGILGPPGAGKSTLLLSLAGMVRPDSGTISWFGRASDEGGRPPGIAYVSHQPTPYSSLSVREAIEFHSTLRGVSALARAAAVDGALAATGLADVERSLVAGLSRGGTIRLALAQAVVGRPRVVLLDDPLAATTPAERRAIVSILRDLQASGATLVIAAEDLDGIEPVASRIALMVAGEIAVVVEAGALRRARALELTVVTPAIARRVFGTRVAEVGWDRRTVRVPLDGTSAEAILARCQAYGIRVERSRVVMMPDSSTRIADAAAQRTLPEGE